MKIERARFGRADKFEIAIGWAKEDTPRGGDRLAMDGRWAILS